jgi:hypothetical protein
MEYRPRTGVLRPIEISTRSQATKEEVMNRFKTFVVTALAAATVATGALVAAPSASAMPNCTYFENKSIAYDNTATILFNLGNYSLGNKYRGMSAAYMEMWKNCMGYG